MLQPRFVPGLALTVDYYDIRIRDVITTIGAQTLINQCYDDPGGIDNQFCRAVFRRPDGTFAGQSSIQHAGQVVDLPQVGPSFRQGPFNFARQRTTGIDFDLNYILPARGDWRLNARGIVAYLIRRDQFTSVTDPNFRTRLMSTIDNPRWAATARATLGFRAVDLSYAFRYIDRVTVARGADPWNQQNPIDGRPPQNADAFPIVFYPAVAYHDLRIQTAVGPHRFYFGVDNVLDKLPPFDILGTVGGEGAYTNTGRFFYTGLNLRF